LQLKLNANAFNLEGVEYREMMNVMKRREMRK
jgi:hypothetical protein